MDKRELKREIKETKDNILVCKTIITTGIKEVSEAKKELKELIKYLKDLNHDLKTI